MANAGEISGAEIGQYLMQVRERAGFKQAELARKITWSPTVLSRVESGERDLAEDELATILEAIDTPEAARLSVALRRHWMFLPRPPLDHPDQELLWEAELVASQLHALRERPDIRRAFDHRLSQYISEIQHVASLLHKRDHQVAFIGSIGIGKSTAICRLTGLEVPGQDGASPVPVLEAGAGGITICEVHLRTGPQYGLIVEPRSDEEIRADVSDFADHMLRSDKGPVGELRAENESQGISKELERAIRNMSGLKVSRREKGADGKAIRRDEAKELAQKCSSLRELIVEILSRMELHRRDRRDIWYDASLGKTTLIWLKETFELINNGRHPDFTLPRRIEVVVPDQLLGASDLTIRIIDTKGIDRTAARADLEAHLDEAHTLAVLCSGFNSAPEANARLLLERAQETGVRELGVRASLLVLPRPSEALAVKDESGVSVETTAEGYELKAEQAAMALEPLGLHDLPIAFFNAYQDDPLPVREFLTEGIERVREAFRSRLRAITNNARTLLKNHEREQVQEVIRAAGGILQSWIVQNSDVPAFQSHVHDSLMEQIANSYASTIRASIRREGEWQNLSYSHHLGYGARRLAAMSLGKVVEQFVAVCRTMSAAPDFQEATDLIEQAERLLNSAYEDLLRKIQIMGQTAFRDELKLDPVFWVQCEEEWGKGPGYRDRIAGRNSQWFKEEPRKELEREMHALLEREWKQALEKVSLLFESTAS